MVGGSARPGVARAQHRGECLTGGVEVGQQRVVPEPALVREGRPLLLRVRADQGGVDTDHVEARVGVGGPRRGPCLGTAGPDPIECLPRRRLRVSVAPSGSMRPPRTAPAGPAGSPGPRSPPRRRPPSRPDRRGPRHGRDRADAASSAPWHRQRLGQPDLSATSPTRRAPAWLATALLPEVTFSSGRRRLRFT